MLEIIGLALWFTTYGTVTIECSHLRLKLHKL